MFDLYVLLHLLLKLNVRQSIMSFSTKVQKSVDYFLHECKTSAICSSSTVSDFYNWVAELQYHSPVSIGFTVDVQQHTVYFRFMHTTKKDSQLMAFMSYLQMSLDTTTILQPMIKLI